MLHTVAMSSTGITDERASYQAVFALDILNAAGALVLLGLATIPTCKRIKARRFSAPSKSTGTPLKTALGTYLFLWPALLCFFFAYTFRFVADLLQTNGFIAYTADLSWNGRPSFSIQNDTYGSTVSALTFATTLATIFFTVLQTGGVWIHATHVKSNGIGQSAPKLISKLWNTFIMLAMLATGLAAWAIGMTKRDITLGSLSSFARLSWSNVLENDTETKNIYIAHQAIVIAASLSVTFQVLYEYFTTKRRAHGSYESKSLTRFACAVVPLIWLRDVFIIFDIVLLYYDTSDWSRSARLATTFLLIIFGQLANLAIFAMILFGAWRMGRSVNVFGSGGRA